MPTITHNILLFSIIVLIHTTIMAPRVREQAKPTIQTLSSTQGPKEKQREYQTYFGSFEKLVKKNNQIGQQYNLRRKEPQKERDQKFINYQSKDNQKLLQKNNNKVFNKLIRQIRTKISPQSKFRPPKKQFTLDYRAFLSQYKTKPPCSSTISQNKQDFEYRKGVFEKNLKIINTHNQNPRRSYDMNINCFCDIDDNEFEVMFLGEKIKRPVPVVKRKRNLQQKKKASRQPRKKQPKNNPLNQITGKKLNLITNASTVKTEYQSYIQSIMLPITHQGSCYSCYAFAVIDSIYTTLRIYNKTKPLKYLSVMELITCAKDSQKPQRNDTVQGCNGGTIDASFRYIREKGIGYEAEDEYIQAQYNSYLGDCQALRNKTTSRIRLRDYARVTKGNCQSLKNILSNQAVAATITIGSKFRFFRMGTYSEDPRDNQYSLSQGQATHSISILGFNEQENRYLIKNSWGPNWGVNGFGYLSNDFQLCQEIFYALLPL